MENKTARQYSLSVFFPFYNEEENIRPAVEAALTTLASMPELSSYEVIVVDDGSKDKTAEIGKELERKHAEVRFISHPVNKGYGAALMTGIHAAKYEYVFFTDGDLQFDIEALKEFFEYVPEYEAVIGYRSPRKDPFMRLVNAWGWKVLIRLLFNLKVRDIDCAFKLFKRDIVSDLPIQSKGAMVSAELLIRLKHKQIKLKELPVIHLPRTAGSPTGAKPAVILRAFKEMFSAYRGDLGEMTRKESIAYQFTTFAFIGVLNTLIDFGIYLFLTRHISFFNYLKPTRYIANVISFMFGTTFSFFFNRTWTFRRTTWPTLTEARRFYTTTTSGLVINSVILYVLSSLLGINDVIAKVFGTIFSIMWNFLFKKLWVFAPSSERQSAQYKINI